MHLVGTVPHPTHEWFGWVHLKFQRTGGEEGDSSNVQGGAFFLIVHHTLRIFFKISVFNEVLEGKSESILISEN